MKMFNLYKLINENKVERFSGDFLVYNNTIYTNPKEEHLRMAGYKDLVEIETPPEYNPETQYVIAKYIEDGDVINVTYIVEDVPTLDSEGETNNVSNEEKELNEETPEEV